MTEEEKKAIEISKLSLCVAHEYNKRNILYNAASLETLLDLIDKQQKEIEELKKPKFIMNAETGEVTKIHNDFISKDKIREILFDIGTLHDGGYIKVKIIRERLEELLEE